MTFPARALIGTSNDAVSQQIVERLNQSGKLYLTHTKLAERYVLRFCVGQTHTERHHVQQAWQRIQQVATELDRM